MDRVDSEMLSQFKVKITKVMLQDVLQLRLHGLHTLHNAVVIVEEEFLLVLARIVEAIHVCMFTIIFEMKILTGCRLSTVENQKTGNAADLMDEKHLKDAGWYVNTNDSSLIRA